jgi:hypothetical protein
MDADALPRLLTPADVGRWLSLPARRVERMAKRGEIPYRILPSGDIVFEAEALAAWARQLPGGGARHAS